MIRVNFMGEMSAVPVSILTIEDAVVLGQIFVLRITFKLSAPTHDMHHHW